MTLFKKLSISFALLGFVAANPQNKLIEYSVISAIENTHAIGVVVDNITYPLTSSKGAAVVHTGQAPIAQFGYQYIKVEKNKNLTELTESFLRKPVSVNTVFEFFNRSWNTREIAKLPQIYKPLEAIHRIKSDLHKDGQIPTISIEGPQSDFDVLHSNITCEDCEVNTNLTYIGLNEKHRFENVRITLSGYGSTFPSKLSYNVKLKKKDRLFDYRRIKLRALAMDPSYLREQLAYDIIESVGLVSSKFSFCRLLINNRDVGLFGIIDTFHNPWLSNVFANGDKDYKNGNLFQGVYAKDKQYIADLDFHKDNITAYQGGQYKVKVNAAGEKEDNYRPLMEFTEFIAKAPTEGPGAVEVWSKKLEIDSFLRNLALEKLLGYSDGYCANANNYYIAQLPETNKFFWISSDMDITLGNSFVNTDDMLSGNYRDFPGMMARPLTSKMLSVNEFRNQFEHLIREISEKLVSPIIMNNRINDLVDMLREDVEWDQSLPRLGKSHFPSFNSSGTLPQDPSLHTGKRYINMTIAFDAMSRMGKISFSTAINGPTGHISLTGLKEWFQKSSENIKDFYRKASP